MINFKCNFPFLSQQITFCRLVTLDFRFRGDLEETEKYGLRLNIQKTKIMASGPITSWQIDGETVETVADFILGGSKITADGDCSHEIKRLLLLRKKVMNNLGSTLKKAETLLCQQRSV